MKKFHYSIFTFCLFLVAFTYGCDKADIQKPIVSIENPIQPRTTCNDCEDGDCCGAVLNLNELDDIDLTFCGVYGTNLSSTLCSDNHFGNCPISGYELTMTLDPYPDLEIFCIPLNSSFSVYSPDNGSVRITCQYGQLTPFSIDLYFPGTNHVYVDEGCIVSGHCPF